MANNLPRVSRILEAGTWAPPGDDRVALDYDDRFRRRIVMTGLGGTRFLLDLPKLQLLEEGDGLELSNGRIVAVEAAPERLTEITCANTDELVRVAWHLGNRHLPTQLLSGKLRIREDHVIVAMVEGLGAHVEKIEAPFRPEGGAYGKARVQGHDHGHSHD